MNGMQRSQSRTFGPSVTGNLDDHALYDLLILRNDNGDCNENFKSNRRISKPVTARPQRDFFSSDDT